MFQSLGGRNTEEDQSEMQATKFGEAVETGSDEVQCFPGEPHKADMCKQDVES